MLPPIKHVSFWRKIDGDSVFLSESSGFLKIHLREADAGPETQKAVGQKSEFFEKYEYRKSKMLVKIPRTTDLEIWGNVPRKIWGNVDCFDFLSSFLLKTNLFGRFFGKFQ